MPLIHLHDYPGPVYLAQHLFDLLHVRVGHRFLFANSSALLLSSIRVNVERVDDLEFVWIQVLQIRWLVAVRGHLSVDWLDWTDWAEVDWMILLAQIQFGFGWFKRSSVPFNRGSMLGPETLPTLTMGNLFTNLQFRDFESANFESFRDDRAI